MAQTNYKEETTFFGKINILMLVITLLIVAACFTGRDRIADEGFTKELEPYSTVLLEDGSTEYLFDLTGYEAKYSGIMFYTSHQIVEAYDGDNQEIYAFDFVDSIWGSTPGSTYNFVEINEEMSQVSIIIKPVYDVVADQDFTFYIGSTYEMYDEIVTGSMPRFVVSLLILIMSALILIYYAVMHEKQQLSKELVYLGYFAFFSGLWSINETDLAAIIVNNRALDAIVPYIAIMFVVPPFIMFFESYLSFKNKFISRIIIGFSMTQTIILTLLHFNGIKEFRETLPLMQLLLIVAVVYTVLGMLIKVVRGQRTRRIEICAVGLSLFFAAILVDIFSYYTSLGDTDKIGRYVFLIFVVMLAWDMIKDANAIIEKGRRAKQLEIFALTDSMTGLLNRNAFESHAKTEGKLEGLVAIVADANGLKACNDTYGHEAGDEYITTVANIFSDVYGKYGNCYRTGGDEFCCIIPASKQVNLLRLKKIFLTKIYTANIEGTQEYNMGVAIGQAKYDSSVDKDFRALVKRADASMYENKRTYKTS